MLRFHYEWVSGGDVRNLNRRLAEGWQPLRELAVPSSSADAGSDAIVLLQREDPLPVLRGEQVAEGIGLDTLASVGLLAGLTGDELRELVAVCTLQRYAAESVLFDEGQAERQLAIVLEGTVSIQLLGLAIDDPVVLQADPGDVFGETTFFAPGEHTTRGTATTAVTALMLSGAAYDELLQSGHPAAAKIARNAAGVLAQRLQSTDAWVRELLRGEESAETVRSFRSFRRGLLDRGSSGGGGFVRP